MIVDSSPVYRKVNDLDKAGGYTDEMICAELRIGKAALNKVRRCLSVIDLDSLDSSKNAVVESEEAAEKAKTEELVNEGDMSNLTAQFDEEVGKSPVSAEDVAKFDQQLEERRAKRRESNKKSRERSKANKEAAKKAVNAKKPATAKPTEVKPTEPEEELGEDNLLANVDLSAFENK